MRVETEDDAQDPGADDSADDMMSIATELWIPAGSQTISGDRSASTRPHSARILPDSSILTDSNGAAESTFTAMP